MCLLGSRSAMSRVGAESYRTGMRILVAPQRSSVILSAPEVARAIAAGWRRARPDDEVVEIPLADGGEGTLEAVIDARGGERRSVTVSGPLGDPVDAVFGLASGSAGRVAVVEIARAAGLHLVSPTRRRPLDASTHGVGELIAAAAAERPAEILLCLCGSATTDGGAGIAQALGARMFDAAGRDLRSGGGALLDLGSIDATGLTPSLRGIRVHAACDVDVPLTGPRGAADTYASRLGVTTEQTFTLDRALGHYAAIVHRDLGIDVRNLPWAGTAGGLGAGLVAFLGARLRPGVDVVMDTVGLAREIEGSDLLITTEGPLEPEPAGTGVSAAVLREAREALVPALVLGGRADRTPDGEGVRRWRLAHAVDVDLDPTRFRASLETFGAEIASKADTLGLS